MTKLALFSEQGLELKESIQELLAFSVNEEAFAVELKDIVEIVVPPPITLVPRAAKAVLGVCSVRGQLVTVVDLRCILGLPASKTTAQGRILLAQSGGNTFGLQVDSVQQVVRLKSEKIEKTSFQGNNDSVEAVRAIARLREGEVIVILDINALYERSRS